MPVTALIDAARTEVPPVVVDPSNRHKIFRPEALRCHRRCAGLSLADVGVRVGRSASVVARYERGVLEPPASMVGALAGALGVEVGAFYA